MTTDAVAPTEITVIVEPPKEINVLVERTVTLPVVTVEIPGIQGPSRADEPFSTQIATTAFVTTAVAALQTEITTALSELITEYGGTVSS